MNIDMAPTWLQKLIESSDFRHLPTWLQKLIESSEKNPDLYPFIQRNRPHTKTTTAVFYTTFNCYVRTSTAILSPCYQHL